MATNARGQRVLTQKMWGLKALRRLHINARRETVHTATSVKHAFAHGRAVELANGFYEPKGAKGPQNRPRSEEHTSELQSRGHLVCRLLLEKKKRKRKSTM